MIIIRILYRWTSHQNATFYAKLLQEEIYVGIATRNIDGLRDFKLLLRKLETEGLFLTIMSFATHAAVREFASEEYGLVVVPPKARQTSGEV